MEYNQTKEPLLIVISGPSGVGKDATIDRMKARGVPFHFVVTATTRPPRADEVHGEDYFFLSQEEFENMIEQDELLEHAIVYDDFKGVPKEQVRQALASGKDVVMRVDVQGAATVREKCPDAVLIFLNVDSEEDLENRLMKRKSDTPEKVRLRVAAARQEYKRIGEFDYVVTNRENQLDNTVDDILAIIRAEHQRVQQRKVTL
jgi:guanylate kinase